MKQVYDQFFKNKSEILVGVFNVRLKEEDTFKSKFRKESFHENSNDNGFRVPSFSASKSLIIKSTIFVTTLGPSHVGRLTISLVKNSQQSD